MQFLKFFFGITLVQLVTYILILISPETLDTLGLLRIIFPLLIISVVVSFWFTSLSENSRKDALEKLKSSFAKERESLKVNAEKAKTKVIKQAQKDIATEAKVTHAKANFKVGASFAGVICIGGLFVLAQMVTAGLLTLSAVGGAMGGYYWRGKRIENKKSGNIEIGTIERPKVIESKKSWLIGSRS